MIGKVSTFSGPSGLFQVNSSATPSLVLSLDAGNILSYPKKRSTWFDLTTLNNDAVFNGLSSPTFSTSGGGSFEFNGDYFYLPNTNVFNFNPVSYNVTTGTNSVVSTVPEWDNGAWSVESYSTKIKVKYQLGENPVVGNTKPAVGTICGLSDDPLAAITSYNRVKYGFYTQGPNTMFIWENDAEVFGLTGTFSTSTIFSIVYDTNSVKYYIDDILVYTSLSSLPTSPLYFYSTFNSSNSISIVNIEFGPYFDAIPVGNEKYTIETWFNTDDLSKEGVLVGRGDGYEYNKFGISNSQIFVSWYKIGDRRPNNLISLSQSIIAGNWYNVATTYDGLGSRSIYLNGSLIASDNQLVYNSISNSNFQIGSFLDTDFIGKMSIVKVHTKALSESKLLSNFNSLKTRFGYTYGSMTFNEEKTSYLTTSSSDYAFRGKDFTVEAFFKAATASNSTTGIVSLRNFGATIGVSINIDKSNTSEPLIEFNVGGGKITYTASNDQWYHVAISKTGGTSSFFVNGNLLTSVDDYRSLYGNVDLVVGRYYTDYNGYYFNGIISNVRVVRTGLYTGTFSPPSTPLSGTESNTKLLISSQEMNPTADLTGLNSVTASNIGWTSSIPYIAPTYITDHLELYVDAGVLSSYPGSKNTLYDLSPNGFNMTIGTGSTWSYKLGGVIDFDGSYLGLDGPVSTNSVVSVTHSTGFTMETMVKFNNINGEGIFSFNGGRFANSRYINLTLDSKTDEIIWYVNNGSAVTGNTFIRPTYTFNTGTWYHIVATHDTNFLVVYVNGIMIGSALSSIVEFSTNTTAKFVLGMIDLPLNGSIGFARFYSKPLLAADVTNNFDANRSRFGL